MDLPIKAIASAVTPRTKKPIAGAEVKTWFERGPKSKPWPSDELCAEVANRLNRMRWGGQPSPEITEPRETDPWWDPEKAADAARALLDDIPAMLQHWQRLRTNLYETLPGQKPARVRDGYDAIERLHDALAAAIDYIEFPFGVYDREEARKRLLHPKRPKLWHASAVAVAYVIIPALRRAGHNDPGTSHNAIAVQVARDALKRMRYGKIEAPAIAKVLTKWKSEFGREF